MSNMQKRILIVDDDDEIRELLEFDVSQSGYFVDTAKDGMEGLHKALNNTYDLILLDVMMPKMNGFDVCKNIRQAKLAIPILMLTAKGTIDDKTEGFDCGADDYLVKDFFKALHLPVIIVVKPLLGNVNHAVLSAYYAQHEGLNVLGFIVNGWDEAHAGVLERSNLYYYEKLTGLPVLGKLPVLDKALLSGADMAEAGKIAAANIDLERIYKALGDSKDE